MTLTTDKPDWWHENEQLREEMELPEYRPSRFEDGTFTHEVVEQLKNTHDCQLRFVGIDTRYPDSWVVQINDELAFEINRHRDEQGNTVYEMTTEKFREMVSKYLSDKFRQC